MPSLNNLIRSLPQTFPQQRAVRIVQSPVHCIRSFRWKLLASPKSIIATPRRSSKTVEACATTNSQCKRVSRLPRTPAKRCKYLTLQSLRPSVQNVDTDYNRTDEINWDISEKQVEEMKAKLVPQYWQSLQGEPYAVMWLSPRLYIVQDWNIHFNYLIVESIQLIFSDTFRRGNTDMYFQWSKSLVVMGYHVTVENFFVFTAL